MKRFAALYDAIDRTTSTNKKVAAMAEYFRAAPAEDAAWALYFLTGQRPKRLLGVRLLAEWAMQEADIAPWLFEECYGATGDLAETVALILPAHAGTSDLPLHTWVETLLTLRKRDVDEQHTQVLAAWQSLDQREIYMLNKLLTGELRVGVSQTLVMRAVAQVAGLDPPRIAHRLMGTWTPSAAFFTQLIAGGDDKAELSRPYPFYLAAPLEDPVATLGDASAWQLEWKWDGIRGQLLRRDGRAFLWSRGEELITDRFPEISSVALADGLVIDGEVLAYAADAPLPFAALQRRIGRQKLTPKVLAEAPVVFMAYDLLEYLGHDIRARPLSERRALLEGLGLPPPFRLSPVLHEPSWEAFATLRESARARGVEGFMLKRLSSPYGTGRKRGDWWKWKIDPFTVDAVLVYAQPGSGRRANLLTDYTFAVWQDGVLLPIAKAYSGLSDAEIKTLDAWIRAHTIERFGPVRHVEPTHVFELAFEGIARSPRHKSGIAVRFPRIARWRTDKPAAEADTLAQVTALIEQRPAR